MKNPLRTKNTSTPANPPGSHEGRRWYTTTPSTATATPYGAGRSRRNAAISGNAIATSESAPDTAYDFWM